MGKKGVVKDASVHIDVIRKIFSFCDIENLSIIDLTYSPIKGPEGNIEYLVYLEKTNFKEKNIETFSEENINSVVAEAHKNL